MMNNADGSICSAEPYLCSRRCQPVARRLRETSSAWPVSRVDDNKQYELKLDVPARH
jgi:hypothetical protein